MSNSTRICKICGKEYPYCKTELKDDIFRWQDVACCQEHGSEYFALVAASRGEVVTGEVIEPELDEIVDDYEDEEEDDCFDDEYEDEDIDDQ